MWKNKAAKSRQAPSLPEPEIVGRAERERAGGNPRRAREGYRRLFKQDPEKYGPVYAEVTLEAADAFAREGKIDSALQLVAHLVEIRLIEESDAAATRRRITLLAVSSGKTEPRPDGKGDSVAVAREVLALETGDSKSPNALSGPALVRAADVLVLARAEEATPVIEAIGHLCRRDWAALETARRQLPRQSPFAHWMVFLRGCAAYYRSEFEEAARCFDRLPPDSRPARKAEVFRRLMGRDPGQDLQTIREAATLFGDDRLSQALPELDRLWKKGRFLEAYQAAKKCLPGFPVLGVSMRGELTRFFQLADLHLPPSAFDRYAESILELIESGQCRPDNAEGIVLATVAIRFLRDVEDPLAGDAVEDLAWQILFRSWKTVLGGHSHLDARLYRERALHHLAGIPREDYPYLPRHFLSPVIELYRRSIEADPAFEISHRDLVHLYEAARNSPERNRLLDLMTKRFPDSPGVLLDAGRGCVDRNAFSKALKYLERARDLDPVNLEIGREHRRALRGKAIWQYRTKNNPAAGRTGFEELLECPYPPHTPLLESRVCDHLRWALLEDLAALPDNKSAQLRHRADLLEPLGEPAINAFFWIERQKWEGIRAPLIPSLPKNSTPSEIRNLARIWSSKERRNLGPLAEPTVARAVQRAAKTFKKSDRALAVETCSHLLELDLDFWTEALAKIAKRMLSYDRRDPFFLAMKWLKHKPSRKQLEEAQKTAETRRDREAIEVLSRIEKMLNRFEAPPVTNPFFGAAPLPDFGPPSDFDIENLDDTFGPPDEPELDPTEFAEEFASVLTILRCMPKSQRLAFLIEAGLPKPLAEVLVRAANKAIQTGRPLDLTELTDLGDLLNEFTSPIEKPAFGSSPFPKKPKPEPVDPRQQEFSF